MAPGIAGKRLTEGLEEGIEPPLKLVSQIEK